MALETSNRIKLTKELIFSAAHNLDSSDIGRDTSEYAIKVIQQILDDQEKAEKWDVWTKDDPILHENYYMSMEQENKKLKEELKEWTTNHP